MLVGIKIIPHSYESYHSPEWSKISGIYFSAGCRLCHTIPISKTFAEQLVQNADGRLAWAGPPATSTNYSVRLPEDAAPAYCAITSSGVDKSRNRG